MGRIAFVIDFERGDELDEKSLDVKVDPGGGAVITCTQFGPPGLDAPPLAGDYAAVVTAPGDSSKIIVGYADPTNEGTAEAGEYRAYSRDADGVPMVWVHLKADGTARIENENGFFELKLDGQFNVNDNFTVDP